MPTATLKRFLVLLISWSGGLFVLLLIQSRSGPAPVGAVVPHLAYQALLLACFPAGLGVAHPVGSRRIQRAGFLLVGGTSMVLAGVVFVGAGWVAPTRLAEAGPRAMTTPVLSRALTSAIDEAERTDAAVDWARANTLVFEHDRRYVQAVLAPLLAVLGILVGLVGGRIPPRGIRMAFFWGVGVFLVISEYFAFENAFELVAIRTVGVVTPAGLFGLIVPGTLILGFGAAVAVDVLWSGREAAGAKY